ncbi:oxygen-dependent protoporphyrinogen oxidase [Martiniozyma asiatica (nom. inval.)]|nr:oxygen-dependent protoporphyrinogen oxidase [Martiniozyma asiatica]
MSRINTSTKLIKLKKLLPNSKVVVVGGGISGLTFTYFLSKLRPDIQLTLLEKEKRFGGYINSAPVKINGISAIFEKGPRTLRGVSSGTLLITDLLYRTGNLNQLKGVHLTSNGNKKFLVSSNDLNDLSLVEVPGPGQSFNKMLKFLSSKAGISAIKGAFKSIFTINGTKNEKKELSVEEFFTRHFGKDLIYNVGSALMYGVYAADVKDLSARCVMPSIVEIGDKSDSIARYAIGSGLKKAFGNAKANDKYTGNLPPLDEDVKLYRDTFETDLQLTKVREILKRFPMLAFNGGLEKFCQILIENMPANVNVISDDALAKIEKKGDNMIVYSKNGKEFECDHVRSTIGAKSLGACLQGDSELRQLLLDYKYTSVSVVNVFIEGDVKNIKGFGFLIPKAHFNKDNRLIGVIFDSDVESSAKPIFTESILNEVLSNSPCDVEKLKNMALAVHKGSKDLTPKYTKVTLMINIDPLTQEIPSESKIKMIVKDTFERYLNAPLDNINWHMESNHWLQSIPLYDLKYLERKDATFKQLKQYDNKLSLGGMSFAHGVGVPDNVVSSFNAAIELSK